LTTINSPEGLYSLHNFAINNQTTLLRHGAWTAELIREVSLKCIPFNGLPRTINALGNFRNMLPDDISKELSMKPNEQLIIETGQSTNDSHFQDTIAQGRRLWDSIYSTHSEKLISRLGRSHPDLPAVIFRHQYPLLASVRDYDGVTLLNRILTSVIAVSCLRAQQGSSRQLESHVYGLGNVPEAKINEDINESESGIHWLVTDDGCKWIIETVDSILHQFKVRIWIDLH
jgi:hypothetical protein